MLKAGTSNMGSADSSTDANPDPTAQTSTDGRLTELEIKLAFTEDLVDSLNAIVIRQQQQLDALIREVTWLRSQAPSDTDANGAASRSLRDELPPHY